jgi:hypothetical protein
MTTAEISARADRVAAIVEGNYGKVLNRAGNIVVVEIPADIAVGMAPVWGMAGFIPIFRSQDTHLAERRVVDMNGHTTICKGDWITMAYYRFDVDLRPRSEGKPAPTPAAITAPTRPVGG